MLKPVLSVCTALIRHQMFFFVLFLSAGCADEALQAETVSCCLPLWLAPCALAHLLSPVCSVDAIVFSLCAKLITVVIWALWHGMVFSHLSHKRRASRLGINSCIQVATDPALHGRGPTGWNSQLLSAVICRHMHSSCRQTCTQGFIATPQNDENRNFDNNYVHSM